MPNNKLIQRSLVPEFAAAAPRFLTEASQEEVRQTISWEQSLTFAEDGDKGKGDDLAMTNQIGVILGDLYQDHLWGVRVSHRQGIIEIKMPAFTSFSYVIHIKNVASPNDLRRRVMRAAGEFLEIYKQPRARFDPQSYQDTMKKLGPTPTMNPLKVSL